MRADVQDPNRSTALYTVVRDVSADEFDQERDSGGVVLQVGALLRRVVAVGEPAPDVGGGDRLRAALGAHVASSFTARRRCYPVSPVAH